MNWDDDEWNPYGKKGWFSKDQRKRWNDWGSRSHPRSSKELDDMIKKAWEKLEHWVPKRDPALTESLTLTPDWSDIEKLYKHIARLYKHITVLHDEVERLKKKNDPIANKTKRIFDNVEKARSEYWQKVKKKEDKGCIKFFPEDKWLFATAEEMKARARKKKKKRIKKK